MAKVEFERGFSPACQQQVGAVAGDETVADEFRRDGAAFGRKCLAEKEAADGKNSAAHNHHVQGRSLLAGRRGVGDIADSGAGRALGGGGERGEFGRHRDGDEQVPRFGIAIEGMDEKCDLTAGRLEFVFVTAEFSADTGNFNQGVAGDGVVRAASWNAGAAWVVRGLTVPG